MLTLTDLPALKVWRHSRKGTLTGVVVDTSSDGVWVTIRLHGKHQPHYYSAANRGKSFADGECITVRAAFLTEISQDGAS